jgi:hypothetical protein
MRMQYIAKAVNIAGHPVCADTTRVFQRRKRQFAERHQQTLVA